jgi:hypothetical protein
MSRPAWLALLAELPTGEGEFHSAPMSGEPFAGWEQMRIFLGDGDNDMRVVTAIFDADGKPGMVSDLIATARGLRQESMGARFDSAGSIEGTYWMTQGDRMTPRPLTDGEKLSLRDLAETLWRETNTRRAV